jgi:hypothetical protein
LSYSLSCCSTARSVMRSVVVAVDGPDRFFFAAAAGGPQNSARSAPLGKTRNEVIAVDELRTYQR